jgi:glutathione S-transferase
MAELTLIIGNKNHSSWSLRGFLALAQTGAAFEEVVVPLSRPDTERRLAELSPSGLVPVLRAGDETVWDTLAIGEYCAERWPEAGLWPDDAVARARARSVCAEMHSGFAELRRQMPMDMRAERPGKGRTPGALRDIDRILAIWSQCLARSGGPWLFGPAFTLADAFYAPVVSRFRTYAVPLDGACAKYAETMWRHEPLQRWLAAARDEPWMIEYALVG